MTQSPYGPPAWPPHGTAPVWPARAPAPRPVAYPVPARLEQVPGTPFVLAHLPVPRTVDGVGFGALMAGIGAILVSFAAWLFGLRGATSGWGLPVAGAFVILAGLAGAAGIVLGTLSLRRLRAAARSDGRGLPLTGIWCGVAGATSAVTGLAVAGLVMLAAG